ncbi:MAG TPA: CBS domain-containing protein [Thermotogota bacterium]|nr:CBS domain-containing protein [Thermotogaceae bacterium]HNR62830.1 CBS domain-containing protein [Thermotogota bacterium]HNT94837.1 CBS domain-containing protein [Thermotogota bacterium]HPX96650.1 CBS domain-containing protein [Thermotogota bacterium]HQC37385.1 CBS domain-containing protein [Thermotogota bacterium]
MLIKDAMIRDVSAIFEDEKIETFIRISALHLRHVLPVVDEKMRIIGIISEDDVINETIPSYFGLLQSASFIPDTNQMKRKLSEIKDEPIGKFINRNVITIEEEDTILHAADLLLRHKFMNLFVVDKDSRLTGIINRSRILLGVLQEVLEEKAAEEK